ncbi:MAG TPA: DUF6367 family protein [Candidatus Saccharimonadales bacterium]|nr:DUF6367 family protein [Candidatus Saccharimonadales bacterium]
MKEQQQFIGAAWQFWLFNCCGISIESSVDLSYLIVEVDAIWLERAPLEEGVWKQSEYPDYFFRIDAGRPEMKLQRHVHIAHKKHLKSPSDQVSWNTDSSRHDKSTFAYGFKGMEKAKEIAKRVLNLGDDAVLESISDSGKAKLLVEAVLDESPFSASRVVEMPILVLKRRHLTVVERAVQILEEMDAKPETRIAAAQKARLAKIKTKR